MEKLSQKRLDELLLKVFTPSGEIKACGRNVCSDLITAAHDCYPHICFGDPDTGMMNVSSFRELFFSNR